MTKPDIEYDNHFETPITTQKNANRNIPKSIEDLIIEMQGKSIAIIVQDQIAYEVTISRTGKSFLLNFKHIAEDTQKDYTRKKVEDYEKYRGVGIEVIQGIGTLFSIRFGQAGMGVWQGISQAVLSPYHNHQQTEGTAAHTGFDHKIHVSRTSYDELKSYMHNKDQQVADSKGIDDRIRQLLNELFRVIGNA